MMQKAYFKVAINNTVKNELLSMNTKGLLKYSTILLDCCFN